MNSIILNLKRIIGDFNMDSGIYIYIYIYNFYDLIALYVIPLLYIFFKHFFFLARQL
jgi:hypothetical protein